MTKKSLTTIFTIIGILLTAIQSHAGIFTAFGQKTFIRGSGSPVVETAFFSTKNPNTTYTLKVFNGGTNSEYAKVSSAVIKLNGSTIFGSSDFNQQVSTLQKQVNISNSNQLQVELRSAPGSAITAILEGEDNTSPSVAINSPSNGSYTNSPSISVSGTASDSISWVNTVTINGTNATLAGENYTSNVQLTEGPNTITAVATDAAGNTGNTSVSVILDTIPPRIILDTLPSLTNKPQLTITGKIEDANPLFAKEGAGGVIVNGIPATLSNNAFSATIILTEGNNAVSISAIDKAGNIGKITTSILLDTIPPTLSIITPADKTTINKTFLTITGTAIDTLSGVASVSVNGISASLINGTYTADINLIEGPNAVTVTATDAAGNTISSTITVHRDTTAPVITITSPANGSTVNTSTITVSGTIDDGTATVTVNGINAPISGNSFSASNISLSEGSNTITVTAKDQAGNTSFAAVTINYTIPKTGPTISLQYPSNGEAFSSPWIRVMGSIDDGTAMVTMSGEVCYVWPASLPNNFTFYCKLPAPLTDGENTITVKATNASGTTSSSVTVYYKDTTPPSIWTWPISATAISPTTDITFYISEDTGISSVKVNDIAAMVSKKSDGYYSVMAPNVPLAVGPNTIIITATDTSGNTSAETVTVTYTPQDTIAPIITIISPINGSTLTTSTITVTGSIDDNTATVIVNGVTALVSNNNFTATGIALTVGANTITVTATDPAGNTRTATLSVTYVRDTTPPLAVINSPANGTKVNTGNIAVTGIIDDSTATVTVNGINATVSNNTFMAANIPLTEGINTITVTATDPAGNTSNATVTVYRDTTPPQIALTSPANNALNILIDSEITVKFNEPVDPSTITTSVFILFNETGTVPGAITYNEATSTAVFKPLSELAPNTNYTATIKSGIKDLLGNATTTDYTWGFKTGIPAINIAITEPQTGTTINKTQILIKGTVESRTIDTGIRVNGIIAEVNGNNWAAIVPLTIGTNTITAEAVNGEGGTGKTSITINTQTQNQPVKITTNPQSGIAPLNATFTIDTNISNPITSYKIDFGGDGITDLETTDVSNITQIYDTPGIYYPTVTVTDNQGNTYTETTVINVLSKAQMDALLKGKWDGMKGAMGNGDVESTLKYFSEDARERYRSSFTKLKDKMPAIVTNMQDIELIYLMESSAKYRITREQLFDGQLRTITYYIYFIQNKDGIWQIEQF